MVVEVFEVVEILEAVVEVFVVEVVVEVEVEEVVDLIENLKDHLTVSLVRNTSFFFFF